ncbi:hypothetical protein PENTCL1PPCAC_13226, partial [Pristionchus entomophagus]
RETHRTPTSRCPASSRPILTTASTKSKLKLEGMPLSHKSRNYLTAPASSSAEESAVRRIAKLREEA